MDTGRVRAVDAGSQGLTVDYLVVAGGGGGGAGAGGGGAGGMRCTVTNIAAVEVIDGTAPAVVTEPVITTGAVVIIAFPNVPPTAFPVKRSVFVVFTAAKVLVPPPIRLPDIRQIAFVVMP